MPPRPRAGSASLPRPSGSMSSVDSSFPTEAPQAGGCMAQSIWRERPRSSPCGSSGSGRWRGCSRAIRASSSRRWPGTWRCRGPDPRSVRGRRKAPFAPGEAGGRRGARTRRTARRARRVSARHCLRSALARGGERFDLRDVGRLTYITGPLGSGKTRLARAIAAHLPGGVFLGLDRLEADGSAALARPASDPALAARVEAVTGSLVEDGACRSPALLALLVGLDADAPVVIDMVEQGLDQVTQDALGTYLRQRGRQGGPVFLMTRSSAILDLTALGADEAILYCSAIHSPTMRVAPIRGRPGTSRSPPALHRPMCGRAPKASSPGARRRSPDAVGPARPPQIQIRLAHGLVRLTRNV